MHASERGENYIASVTPAGPAEPAVEAPFGLDFPAQKRVNPEDLIAGGPQ